MVEKPFLNVLNVMLPKWWVKLAGFKLVAMFWKVYVTLIWEKVGMNTVSEIIEVECTHCTQVQYLIYSKQDV